MTQAELMGWTSTRRLTAEGAVESEQRVRLERPVVEPTEDGARWLAGAYWAELRRFGRGLLSVREQAGGVEVRFLGPGPRLLSLGPLEAHVTETATVAAHEIVGGLLVRRPGGRISFEQLDGELRSRIGGFHPRRGPFYALVQWNLHVKVSRAYFRRLIGGGAA
ncbi:MAG TPA: hypothetical protein VHH55_02855 [Gaiellaceae bacterium]|jgi:hypothetical protein|nr:hypothetical protein [Gaiellaceae bacterium]